jgi:hypothetical protein
MWWTPVYVFLAVAAAAFLAFGGLGFWLLHRSWWAFFGGGLVGVVVVIALLCWCLSGLDVG